MLSDRQLTGSETSLWLKPNRKLRDTGASVVGIDYVELYVSEIDRTAQFFESALGLHKAVTFSHWDHGDDRRSIALERNEVRLVLTAPRSASSSVAEHLQMHGEGVKDVAFAVTEPDELFERAIHHGARAIAIPTTEETLGGPIRTACIGVYGDVVHSLIRRSSDRVPFPEVVGANGSSIPDTAIEGLDHLAIALNVGELDRWVTFYVELLGFRETYQQQVDTEFSAMRSKVVQSENGAVRFVMMEAAPGKRKSQIETYIDNHHGSGTQHLAFRSSNIVFSMSAILAAGLDFLPTPKQYYDGLEARIGPVNDIDILRKFGILADRETSGTLLQVFTKPITVRPTLFLEVIERQGAEGFGSGNVKALFEAVEQAQAAGQTAT